MQAQKLLRQRPGHLEQLENEINSGAWTGRLRSSFPLGMVPVSCTNDFYQIDKYLRNIVSNWSDAQLEVIPLPPIAKLENALIETQMPVAAENLRQASTVEAALLMEASVNAARHEATGAKFAMKRADLLIDNSSVIDPDCENKAM